MKIKKRQHVLSAALIFALIIGIPIFLQYAVFGNSIPSNTSNDGWAGFFGSYLGGILGGCATLLGVVYTIKKTHEESETNRKKELRDRQRQSALVIYYDFGFAFDNIKDYLSFYSYEDFKQISLMPLAPDVYDQFEEHTDCFTQLYFQSDWIKTVSQLSGATVDEQSTIDAKDIYNLYRIYGNLMTILNWIKYSGPKTGLKAVRAMLQMQRKNELDLTKGELYSKIRKLAFDNEPRCNAF